MRRIKQGKKKIALLLAAVMAFAITGCGNSGGQTGGATLAGLEKDNPKGRYMETELSKPENFQGSGSLVQMSDGTLGILDVKNGIKNISADEGNTWVGEDIPSLQERQESTEVTSGALAPDGGIFYSYVDWSTPVEGQLMPEQYVYIGADGNADTFQLGLADYKAVITEAVFSPQGYLFFIANDMNVYAADLQGHTAKKIFAVESGKDLAMYADEKRLTIQDGLKVYLYDYESEEVNAEDSVVNSFIAEQEEQKEGVAVGGSMEGDESEVQYYAACGGLFRHVIGGSVMEQLADGNLNSLSDPSKIPDSILQVKAEKFLVLYRNGELYSYEYDPQASVVPEEQITLYGLHDNETVRRAISVFRKENPDVYVRFEIGITGKDGMTETDAIHNLNTRLLAGDGPDLLLLDGMPMDSYREKGILADVSGLVDELEAENSYFSNILRAYENEGKIQAIPIRYGIPILMGKQSNVDSMVDLNSLADTMEGMAASGQTQTVMGTYTAEELLEKLYPVCADKWITKDGVNEDILRQFLTQATRIYQAEQKNLTDEMRQQHAKVKAWQIEYFGALEGAKYSLAIDSQVSNMLMKQQSLMTGYLYSMDDYRNVTSYHKKDTQTTMKPWNAQSDSIFCPQGIVGLSAQASNAETAGRFMKTLLQTQVQQMDMGDGFPVNADAWAQYTQAPNSYVNYSIAMSGEDGEVADMEYSWPDEGEIAQLKAIISSLSVPCTLDKSIKDDVLSIAAKTLTGEKEIDKSVQEIIQKISLHLQE